MKSPFLGEAVSVVRDMAVQSHQEGYLGSPSTLAAGSAPLLVLWPPSSRPAQTPAPPRAPSSLPCPGMCSFPFPPDLSHRKTCCAVSCLIIISLTPYSSQLFFLPFRSKTLFKQLFIPAASPSVATLSQPDAFTNSALVRLTSDRLWPNAAPSPYLSLCL